MGNGADAGESIRVENLTKRYGSIVALDSLSFTAEPGEIIGFLGPNGAGKTTTMRILTCFMPASEGEAQVCGYDVFSQSHEVRRRIGYLPENVPLYPEMRVSEYLWFRASIKMRGDSRKVRRRRIAWALAQCHLEDVENRIIGQLSKGYRQRVGLADSLVHDPEVLILDEPTVGLDPNQTRDVRELVKELARFGKRDGRERTILFSTHIIPWVEKVCERVIVVSRGKLVADGQARELVAGLAADSVKLDIRLEGDPERLLETLRDGPMMRSVDDLTRGTARPGALVLGAKKDEAAMRSWVDEQVPAAGGKVLSVDAVDLDLEDVFRSLTRSAHDEDPFVVTTTQEER